MGATPSKWTKVGHMSKIQDAEISLNTIIGKVTAQFATVEKIKRELAIISKLN